ncbi:hypothetical protein [Polaribacter butkevichii]|uniref:Glycosyltransferase RgtA/B/C/D-like domain-containing protein n=1 Tax=Polaribacter butkevichii TaxID=218490 RepID=A0A2P6CEF4_9FLAO|nr:hypothetical protein [Polaribacter butkevichii]PQJ73289.1 hypothetical protein BTO14_08450 [Polaribacter butkevichii]
MLQKVSDLLLNSKKNRILFFSFLAILIFLISRKNGIFWDNVLFSSKIGSHLYNNSLFNWILPDNLDAAHPPTFGFLLAIFWKIFGVNLFSSHLLMVPFTIGFFYQIFKFVNYFLKSNLQSLFAFLLIIVDPTLSAQFVLISPEIIQLFFFFFAINSILYRNNTLKIIALFFLSIISIRSMMLCFGVFLFDIINRYNNKESVITKKLLLSYFIGSIPAFSFLIAHYLTKGWLYSHDNSPWKSNHEIITLGSFLKNCIVLVHRYLDFGRVFIIIFIIVGLVSYGKKFFKSKKNKQLILILITSILAIVIASLSFTNPIGHRYFIVSYICFTLLAFIILNSFYPKKRIIYSLLFIGLLTGNLWIYPKKISQGWDATLAHIPYYNLRLTAIDYLDKNNIPIKEVATFFPNITSLHNIDLNNDKRTFATFNNKNNYVFYSNIYNLSDEELDILDKNYSILKEFDNFNITITIYTLNKK